MTIHAQPDESIAAALAQVGLRPKTFREETEIRMVCPKCHGGTELEQSLSLKIDPGSHAAVWHCWRGTCGYVDNLIIPSKNPVVPFRSPPRTVRKPPEVAGSEQKRTKSLYDFFAQRGISAETVDSFGCYETTHWFFKKGDHPAGLYPATVFPYVFENQIVNRKYRSPHRQLMQEKDPLHTLFNIDSITDIGHVVWVEGETDCMAVHEAGWKQVVSLKDGASKTLRDEDDPKRESDRRFEALTTHAEKLSEIEKFYLAGDNDEPGLVLREELARRLGRNRCLIVTWPEGCKDACDVMVKFGEDVVCECIHNAKPYPIDDVQEITGAALDAYLELPAPKVMTTGATATDQILKLPGEGRLIIVTGVPSSGKSTWTMFVMLHLILREDRRFLVFSPEMQPFEEFAVLCAQVLNGKPARRGKHWIEGDPIMSRKERVQVGDWLRDRMKFLATDSLENPPTLDLILDRATQSSLRLGITDLLIDPWNEIEHQRNGLSPTDYIGRSLQRLKSFGNRHGCNVWVVAHPTKLRPPTPGEPMPPPGPYDISDSAHWANKADVGITVHTPESMTSIHLWKARFKRWGTKGTFAELGLNEANGRFESQPSVQIKHGPDPWSM
jgi:twinkle protein